MKNIRLLVIVVICFYQHPLMARDAQKHYDSLVHTLPIYQQRDSPEKAAHMNVDSFWEKNDRRAIFDSLMKDMKDVDLESKQKKDETNLDVMLILKVILLISGLLIYLTTRTKDK